MNIKKILVIFLVATLLLTSCVSQTNQTEAPETETAVENPEPTPEPEPTPAPVVEASEEESELIGVFANLLAKADECNLIYTGNVSVNKDMPTQTVDGDTLYYHVDSKYHSSDDIENLWLSTFVPDGKAKAAYDKMTETNLYGGFNGELYIKEHDDLAPLTMGEWDISTIVIKLNEEDQIVAEMETTLVGKPNGVKSLALFNIDGSWVLSDSYFLD